MKFILCAGLVPSFLAAAATAAGSRLLRAARHGAGAAAGDDYTLMQFQGTHCAGGSYVCLSLTLGTFTRKNLPEGRSPEVLCDKLEKDGEDGNFVLDSCPGTEADGCPVDKCKNCTEDAVKHFIIDQCIGGYLLKAGKPEDLGCISWDQVDLGLARWCDRWPTSKHDIKHELVSSGTVSLPGWAQDKTPKDDGKKKDRVNKLVGIGCINLTVGSSFNVTEGASVYKKMKNAMTKYRSKANIDEDES